MKKTKLINTRISHLVASLRHTDQICISDAGLPVPRDTPQIDLALTLGMPSFWDVLTVVASETKFEKVFIAREVSNYFPGFAKRIGTILGSKCQIKWVSHDDLKTQIDESKGVVRSGHNEWYHNVILQAGVIF